MIKDILLIMPNFNWKVKFDKQKDPPMGILYIAAILRQEKYNVKIIDANAEELSIEEVLEIVKDIDPQAIGVSCNYSPLNNLTLKLCEKIKKINSNYMIFVGGNHATASYEYMLSEANGNIDYLIRGQGEKVITRLLEALNNMQDINTVKGIARLIDKKVIKTEDEELFGDLDKLPLPAYDLLNMNHYDRYNILTSRGCPYRCTYCASSVICNRVFYRSPEKVVEEIEYLINSFGYKHFWFSDDTFTENYNHTNELLELIINKNLNITWSCLTRVNRTKLEILNKMKKAGCKYISYGVESGDVGMLGKMNKRITLDEIRNALKLTKEANIDMYTFFLIGYPGETIESIQNSFNLICEIRPTGVSYAVVIPLPGTPLWDLLYKEKLIDYDKIQWDYLFAKLGSTEYAAELASTWCELTKDQLIELCSKGTKLLDN